LESLLLCFVDPQKGLHAMEDDIPPSLEDEPPTMMTACLVKLRAAVAWLCCSLEADYEGGDHVILVASVEDSAADHDSSPLLFHRGHYARFG
jgi:hypothetical protein